MKLGLVLVTQPKFVWWPHIEGIFKTCLEDVLKTSSSVTISHVPRRLEASSRHLCKTFSRCLDQDEYIHLGHKSWRRLEDVFKTSWKIRNCYAEDVFKRSSRCHEEQTNVCWALSVRTVCCSAKTRTATTITNFIIYIFHFQFIDGTVLFWKLSTKLVWVSLEAVC